MLDAILRRFISEDAKLIATAMEHWGTDKPLDEVRQVLAMVEDFLAICSRLDYRVITRIQKRLNRAARDNARRARSVETAGKILMGETFEARPAQQQFSNLAAQARLQAQQYSNMAAQQCNAFNQGLGQLGQRP